MHAAVLQDEGRQGVHPFQLLQRHFICGVMCPGRSPALASLLLCMPAQQHTLLANAVLVKCDMSHCRQPFAAPGSKECWLDNINSETVLA